MPIASNTSCEKLKTKNRNAPNVITLRNDRGLSMLKSLKLRYRHVLTIKKDSSPISAIQPTAAIQFRSGCEPAA